MSRAFPPVANFTEGDAGQAGAFRNSRGPRSEMRSGGSITIDVNNPDHIDYLRTGGAPGGGSGRDSAAMRIAAAYRCLHIISGVPGNMPMDLRERISDRESREASSHPNYHLLTSRPNSWQTPQDFKRMLTAHVALRGAGYAIKVPGARGIQELWPVHPDRMQPVMSAAMEMAYDYTSPQGVKRRVPASDVFHVRGLTLDGVNGLGVLAFARETLGMAAQGQRAASRMWKQGAMVGGALEHPEGLGKEAYDRLKASLSEQQSGAENAGKWIILEEGMKVSDVFLSAADMQFLESRQFELRQIAMFFGVPPHMIGDTEKTTSWGSGIEQQKDGFVAFTIEDYLTAWEQSARRDLLSREEAKRFYYRFVRASLIRGDIKTRFGAYGVAIEKRVMTPNEVRALEDLNPRPGGDDFADQPTSAGPPRPQNPDPEDDNDQPQT